MDEAGDGIGERAGDSAADDTRDCPGDDSLAASTDKARVTHRLCVIVITDTLVITELRTTRRVQLL